MSTRLLLFEDLRARGIPYSKEHLRRLERAGKFPKRVKFQGDLQGRHGWEEGEIDTYVASLIAARDMEAA